MSLETRPPGPYHDASYELAPSPTGARRHLTPLVAGEAEDLGLAFAAMDPWAAYGTPAERLAAFFAAAEQAAARHAIRVDGQLAGIVVMRSPWLHGPYLQFLGMLPGHQSQGLGAAVLDWIAAEAPRDTRNLWLCVSAINTRARLFYERHGYRLAAALPGLASDHMDEILMRRRLLPPPSEPGGAMDRGERSPSGRT